MLRHLLSFSAFQIWIAWPLLLWGSATVLIDIMGHQELHSVNGPLMTFNEVNFVQARML